MPNFIMNNLYSYPPFNLKLLVNVTSWEDIVWPILWNYKQKKIMIQKNNKVKNNIMQNGNVHFDSTLSLWQHTKDNIYIVL